MGADSLPYVEGKPESPVKVSFCLVDALHQGQSLRCKRGNSRSKSATCTVCMPGPNALSGEFVVLRTVVKDVYW